MAKMKLKKKKEAAQKSNGPTPGNPLAELSPMVERWRSRGKYLYKVELQSTTQAALISADSKLEAKERFKQLFGITSTDRVIVAAQVENDGGTYPGEVAGFHVDINGVVDVHFGKRLAKPKQDDDRDEME